MGDNEVKREETVDEERKSHACAITFLVLFLILVTPILVLIILISYSCHTKPDLSEYHVCGETVVLQGEEFEYRITYLSYEADSVKLSISIDEEFEAPEILCFYEDFNHRIDHIYANQKKHETIRTSPGWFLNEGRIDVPVETNPFEAEVFHFVEDFKGYVKFTLTDVPGDSEAVAATNAIRIDFY